MITHYEKFRLIDENKENEFTAEVNWNPKDKDSNESKLVKFTFPDGRTAIIKREHLLGMLFAISAEDEQRKMIPQKITRVRNYETVLGIKASKDIYKDEMINVRVKIPINLGEDEIISDINSTLKKQGVQIK